jgi:hypothetical protein
MSSQRGYEALELKSSAGWVIVVLDEFVAITRQAEL